jgi:hypothetical protein
MLLSTLRIMGKKIRPNLEEFRKFCLRGMTMSFGRLWPISLRNSEDQNRPFLLRKLERESMGLCTNNPKAHNLISGSGPSRGPSPFILQLCSLVPLNFFDSSQIYLFSCNWRTNRVYLGL